MPLYFLWVLSCLSHGCVFLWKREAAMNHHESFDPFFRFVVVSLACDTAKALGLVLSPSCHLPHSNRNRARVPRVCRTQDVSLQRKRQLWLPARLCDGGIQTFPLWEHWKLVHKASLQRWAHPIPQKAAIQGNSATRPLLWLWSCHSSVQELCSEGSQKWNCKAWPAQPTPNPECCKMWWIWIDFNNQPCHFILSEYFLSSSYFMSLEITLRLDFYCKLLTLCFRVWIPSAF